MMILCVHMKRRILIQIIEYDVMSETLDSLEIVYTLASKDVTGRTHNEMNGERVGFLTQFRE